MIRLLLAASLCLSPLSAKPPEIPAAGLVRIEAGEPSQARGIGFVVEKDGFILTTYRNLITPGTSELPENIRVFSAAEPGRPRDTRIIGVEPTLDLVILKTDDAEGLVALPRSPDPAAIAPGASIAAVGGINDGDVTLTEGTVTALNTRECYQESLTSTMFRGRIAIPATSTGSPVVLAVTGEVAAIFTGYQPLASGDHAEDAGETHLLPIHLCFNIYESLKQKQSLKSPWTGFSVRPLTEAERRFFPTERTHNGGIGIEHVWKNSPAERLGIRVNDILVQFAYSRILSPADFQKWLYMYGVGGKVKLTILRDGKEYLVTDYVIEERPAWAKPD